MPFKFTKRQVITKTTVSSKAEQENDELETLIQNGDVETAMSRLDNSLDSPCARVYISSARGCKNVILAQREQKQDSKNSNSSTPPIPGFSLIVTAAKSLCPKNPTQEEKEMTLEVLPDTTEEDCHAFFARMLDKLLLLFSSSSSSPRINNNATSRIYIALDDNASQNLKPVIIPFAMFLRKYLDLTKNSNSNNNNNNNNVLVHCVLGRSRSVALVAGYMMFAEEENTTRGGGKGNDDEDQQQQQQQQQHLRQKQPRLLGDVMDDIRKVRSIAEVNPVFGAQLFALWRREMTMKNKDDEK